MTTTNTQVELAAAQSLVTWQFEFANAVREHALQIAISDGHPELVTANDYQQAAISVVGTLKFAIPKNFKSEFNGEQKAA